MVDWTGLEEDPSQSQISTHIYLYLMKRLKKIIHLVKRFRIYYDLLIWHRLCDVNWCLSGSVSALHSVAAASISVVGDHGIRSWWDIIRPKQLSSVSVCRTESLPDFLFMVIQFIIYNFSIQIYIQNLATIVEGDTKAPFSIATTPRCRGRR